MTRLGNAALAVSARSVAGPEVGMRSSTPGLRVSSPADGFEWEAEAAADRILSMPDPGSAPIGIREGPRDLARCAGSGTCHADLYRQPEEEPEEELQRSPDCAAAETATTGDVQRIGTGTPLPGATRSFFEPRFGADLSRVRIHTGSRAADLAQSINARAFTHRQNIAFAPGQYQPDTTRGRHLLAHELTHTIQQHGGPDVVSRAIVYGSGYPRPAEYTPDDNEISHIEASTWYPHTLDFRAAARGSGGGSGRDTFAGFLQFIRAQGVGTINRLGIIGHASRQGLGLAGTVGPNGVQMPPGGAIYEPNLNDNAAAVAAVRDRFAEGAYITMFGCNAGANQGLLDALSNAFGVRVNGFSNPLYFCMSWSTGTPRTLNARGRLDYVPPLQIDPNDPLPPEQRAICSESVTNVWSLNPDQSSTAGVPAPAQPAPAEPAPEGAAP